MSAKDTTDPKKSNLILGFLLIIYTLNFLDRQILSILKEPIAAALHLNDAQLGLMGGVSFALLYTLFAVPIALWADRGSKVWIISISVALWSGFTALCGLASNFTQFFMARSGVGIGEAGGVAPSYSLIADYFPPDRRARAIAIFSYGIPIGSALGVLIGGYLAKTVDWRFAFFCVGGIGMVIAPVFRAVIKDKKPTPNPIKTLKFSAVCRLAAASPAFWLMSLASASSSMVGYGFMYWMPSVLMRSFKLDLLARTDFMAALLFIGGIVGLSLGGVLADHYGKRSKSAYLLIPATGFLLSAPLYGLGVVASTPLMAFWLCLIPQALGLMWFGPIVTAVQHLVPADARTQISSLFLLITNLLGMSLGTYGFGLLSDRLKPIYGKDAIQHAFLYGLGFYVLAALLLWLARAPLKKGWMAEAT